MGAFLDRFEGADRHRLAMALHNEALNPWTLCKNLAPLHPQFSGDALKKHREALCDCTKED